MLGNNNDITIDGPVSLSTGRSGARFKKAAACRESSRRPQFLRNSTPPDEARKSDLPHDDRPAKRIFALGPPHRNTSKGHGALDPTPTQMAAAKAPMAGQPAPFEVRRDVNSDGKRLANAVQTTAVPWEEAFRCHVAQAKRERSSTAAMPVNALRKLSATIKAFKKHL